MRLTSWARRGAFVAGSLHAVGVGIFACVVALMALTPVAQWQLAWRYLELLDWPVSQLLWWGGWPRRHIARLPYQFRDPLWFLIPCLVFGVLGTLWYSLVGGIIGSAIGLLRTGRSQVQP